MTGLYRCGWAASVSVPPHRLQSSERCVAYSTISRFILPLILQSLDTAQRLCVGAGGTERGSAGSASLRLQRARAEASPPWYSDEEEQPEDDSDDDDDSVRSGGQIASRRRRAQ